MEENRKTDRRRQKTRDAIFRALASLLKKKNFSSITVQEIIDEANVGRTTFYSHFETKDQLLEAMCQSIFDHVLSDHPKKESSHDFSKKPDTLAEVLEHVLYHLRDEKEEMLEILLTDSADLFLSYFSENVRSLLKENPKYLPAYSSDLPKDYLLDMMTSGIVETVRWWVKHRMEYSPEQVAAYYENMVPGAT